MLLISNAKVNFRDFFTLFFTLLVVCVLLLINKGGIGSLITYILPFFILLGYRKINLNTNIKTIMISICAIWAMFLFVRSFQYASDYYYHRWNDINPNTMSQMACFAFFYWCSFNSLKKRINKYMAFIMFIITVYSTLNFKSRSETFVCIIFAVLILMSSKIDKRKLVILGLLSILVSFLVPIGYLFLFENNYQFEISGKSLYTGREVIWKAMFDYFKKEPWKLITGLGSNTYLNWGRSLNVHNNAWGIIVDFGFVGFTILYGKFMQIISMNTDEGNKKLIINFICVALLLGSSEITTMWTTTYGLIFTGIGLAQTGDHLEYSK